MRSMNCRLVNTLAAQVGVSVEAGLDATALAIALG